MANTEDSKKQAYERHLFNCLVHGFAMISPLKDIVMGLTLAVGVGLVWRNWKCGEMDRISRFYKMQKAQKAKKKMKTSVNDAD
ncbi:uncharacterized protein IUM83_15412 [Phytophthora cinnamomi]|uniref:uncharacterized protein n=1 Tax=Phytophthora cinnamomi TaxID=4785 RepID=UPI00355A0E90|nr:hypothetical protein IUM83_15412 [Phytophthora cinnamomi]